MASQIKKNGSTAAANHNGKNSNGKRILIVEDERPMAKALELKLGGAGFAVKAVYNGEEAIEELGKEKYDLILLDLVMPKIDGFGVLTWLKSKGNKTPIIITSNLSQDVDEQRAKDLGAIDYFIKSDIPITEVVERVKKALHL